MFVSMYLAVQIPWGKVVRNKPFWAILIAHAGWGFGHTICYAWLPNFYYTTYGISVQNSAWLSALPWVVAVVFTNIGGYVSDTLVRTNTMDRVSARKLLQGLGSLGPAATLLYLAAACNGNVPEASLPVAVSLVTVTLALGGLTAAGYASNHQDLTTKCVAFFFSCVRVATWDFQQIDRLIQPLDEIKCPVAR